MLCTVHILYGKDIKDDTNRVEEIRSIARFLAKRAEVTSAHKKGADPRWVCSVHMRRLLNLSQS
jgi:hypothetical protein